jgi:hypothetical protein
MLVGLMIRFMNCPDSNILQFFSLTASLQCLPGQLDPNEDNSEVFHCIAGNAIWVVIGATAGHAGTWSSDSQVTCRLTGADKVLLDGGAGGALPLQVQVSNQTGVFQT